MNKKMKASLKAAFQAPAPKRKAAFLSTLPDPRTNYVDFLLGQAGFIRKRVWLLSLAAFVAALLIPRVSDSDSIEGMVWVISSFLPFLALAGVTEIARSTAHNMAELEMSCRYSYSHVVLARLGIIGAANLMAFVPVAILFLGRELSAGLALFLPFLLTCAFSLTALSRLRSRECVAVSGVAALAVSLANLLWRDAGVWIGRPTLAGIAVLALLVWSAREIIKFIRKSGEHEWNLSLTV